MKTDYVNPVLSLAEAYPMLEVVAYVGCGLLAAHVALNFLFPTRF